MDLHQRVHPQGTVYDVGRFSADDTIWEVGIAEVGAGNTGAAFEAERAIAFFNPSVALFVGVAGGFKDVALGDVVAASKVYGYESGKVRARFEPRPEIGTATYAAEQRAKVEARSAAWLRRLGSPAPARTPRAFVAPIAAGEKVVASNRSAIYRFLRSTYGDAFAVEMEGRGFLQATRANQQVEALVRVMWIL
jgi:nucleoside phosphorylase